MALCIQRHRARSRRHVLCIHVFPATYDAAPYHRDVVQTFRQPWQSASLQRTPFSIPRPLCPSVYQQRIMLTPTMREAPGPPAFSARRPSLSKRSRAFPSISTTAYPAAERLFSDAEAFSILSLFSFSSQLPRLSSAFDQSRYNTIVSWRILRCIIVPGGSFQSQPLSGVS